MNIVETLNEIISKLNDKESCGLCWNFVPGGRQDLANMAKLDCDDLCCATVLLLRNTFTTGYITSNEFITGAYKDWNVQLFIGIPSRLDIQFYNEIDKDDTCGSKWSKYLHPIACCMEGMDVTICDQHNCEGCETFLEVRRWDAEMKLNYLDNNYDGWLINATFREGTVYN